MAQPLSPELALRIGLAAKALPNITPGTMVGLQLEVLKLPLTDAKLKILTINQLRSAGNGKLQSAPRQELKNAIAYIWDKAGIYPVKYPQTCQVRDALGDIQQILRDAPPPWLGKLMGKQELLRRRVPQLLAVPN